MKRLTFPSYSFTRILASNFPRSVLRKADALPSSLIERDRAAYNLDAGVLPPGEALHGHNFD